ncbi:MAG TPA: hypothetical protein VFE05_07870 [Longimicrobiaceae bacterium]|jgi:hypothetical protein|nr:hypothetical protein [Longimicrobiaceae bacterium]
MENSDDPGMRRDAPSSPQGDATYRAGAPAVRPGAPVETDEERGARARRDPGAIRTEDTEPYIALQYVARLFKIVAMVVIVALTAEIVMGVVYDGAGALLPLIAEVVKGGVLAAILWGVSDLTLLFIDVGHDVRAQRVLLGRLTARSGEIGGGQRSTTRSEPR